MQSRHPPSKTMRIVLTHKGSNGMPRPIYKEIDVEDDHDQRITDIG